MDDDLGLSTEDVKKIMEAIENPEEPNEALKRAVKEYNIK